MFWTLNVLDLIYGIAINIFINIIRLIKLHEKIIVDKQIRNWL